MKNPETDKGKPIQTRFPCNQQWTEVKIKFSTSLDINTFTNLYTRGLSRGTHRNTEWKQFRQNETDYGIAKLKRDGTHTCYSIQREYPVSDEK